MKIGKLTDEQLQSLVIGRLPALSATTLSGAGIGADCAWIRTGEDLMVTSSDPITAGGTESGTLAIHVSCNDIAACGVRPSGILIVIIAPPSVTEEDIKMTVDQASSEAQALGVDIVGGHTEVSDAVNKMIVVSTAFGLVRKGGCVPLGKAMPGDSLIMTKTAGIEGSFIAANEHKDKLSGKVSEDDIKEALSYKSLISVVKEGAACGNLRAEPAKVREDGFVLSAVNLMHDVTEGGVFGAAFEMADFSKTGAVIDKRLVPFTKATTAICSALGLDAFRLISSGSLMIATPEPDRIISELKEQGVPTAVIGRFTDRSEGVFYIENDGSYVKLSPPGADEIYSI